MILESLKKIPLLQTTVRTIRKVFRITPESLSINYHKKRSLTQIQSYLKNHEQRKIQIGAQSNSIDGWLNVDLIPKSDGVVFMDATKPFPFPSNSIDYIFTEHMIEHINLQDGMFMISECCRVLKPGGSIRISTPNLAFLIELYQKEKNETQQNYIQFSIDRYLKNQVPQEDVYVINNFFRDWGHQFIHDIKSLTYLLIKSGFQDVRQCSVMHSDDVNFQNLEQHGKEINPAFNVLESIIVEARK